MNIEWKDSEYTNFLDGSVVKFSYVSTPSIVMQQKFVDEVVGVIVLENYYHSMLLDTMFNFLMIRDFTNVDVDYVLDLINDDEVHDYWEQENSIEEFINSNNLSYILREEYGDAFIESLYDNIMYAIEYKTGIHVSRIEKEIVSLLSFFNKYLKEIDVDKMSQFVENVNNIENISADDIIKAYISNNAGNQNETVK